MINIEVMVNLNRESTNLGGHLGKLVVAPKFHLVKLLNQDHQTQTCQIIFLVRNYSYSWIFTAQQPVWKWVEQFDIRPVPSVHSRCFWCQVSVSTRFALSLFLRLPLVPERVYKTNICCVSSVLLLVKHWWFTDRTCHALVPVECWVLLISHHVWLHLDPRGIPQPPGGSPFSFALCKT